MKRLLLVIPAVIGISLGFLLARPGGRGAEAATSRSGRLRASYPIAGAAIVAALVFGTVGGTYAAWSDFQIIGDNRAGAGTLIMTSGDALGVTLPTSPSSDADTLTVANVGTTPAELGLSLIPSAATAALCSPASAGQVLLTLVGTTAGGATDTQPVGDVCGSLSDLTWPGRATLDPDGVSEVSIDLRVDLGPGAHPAWSGSRLTFDLEVTGTQPGGGFSDFSTGTFTVDIGILPPLVPGTCHGDPRTYPIQVHLGNGNRSWSPSTAEEWAGPAYITAGNGNVEITGTNGDDCIIVENGKATIHGGPGHDVIVVGNGKATVHGGPGNDIIVSEHPNGKAQGGGNATLYGDEGNDHLIARRGNVTLIGGDGIDTCEAPGANLNADCEFVNGVAIDAAVKFSESESSLEPPDGPSATVGDDAAPDDEAAPGIEEGAARRSEDDEGADTGEVLTESQSPSQERVGKDEEPSGAPIEDEEP